ncbi:DUF397 domain-containing protein [Streptomyces sp. NPDC001780]
MSAPKDAIRTALLHGKWQKSSFSNGSGSDCFLMMRIPGGVAVGDSKRRDLDGALRFTDAAMSAHIRAVKAGRYGERPAPGATEV